MTSLDRADLIELLERLGSEDDTAVLEAARALHRKVAESGLSWDDLIQPDRSDEDPVDAPEEVDAVIPAGPGAAETLRLIDRLLRKGVSDSLREDLLDMKGQLASGTLNEDDRRYVRSVAKRLGV
jgi:hypothetical protein